MNKSEQLIACLEGEIAKRDEELAACRIAVENCDLFRARIVELEEKLAVDDDANFNLRGLLQRGAFALGLDPENTSWFEVIGEIEKQGTELAAIKAQEPVAWVGAIEGGVPLLVVEPQNWKATPLFAAPVSEAKAQGVVQWPEADEIMQMAFEEGQPADDASGYYFELEEFDLFIERLMSEVARLNAATVQQVSVPDGWKMVPVELTPKMIDAAEEAHMPFGDMDIALRMAILSAPSAPATGIADASVQGVNAQLLAEYPDEMANGGKMANCNTDCRSAEGVTVGLIDGLITIARVLTLRDLSPADVQEALSDLRSDEDLARVLGPAIGKGVNAQLLEALEALEEAARQVMAGEMAPSSIMVERMKSRAAIAAARKGEGK